MIWKIKKLDWQAVGTQIRAEEKERADRRYRRLDPTPTPYLDDVAKAVSRLGSEESLVRYRILAYADRNNFCQLSWNCQICQFEQGCKTCVAWIKFESVPSVT